MHVPTQAVLQQTPSTQNWLWQSLSQPQAWPFMALPGAVVPVQVCGLSADASTLSGVVPPPPPHAAAASATANATAAIAVDPVSEDPGTSTPRTWESRARSRAEPASSARRATSREGMGTL